VTAFVTLASGLDFPEGPSVAPDGTIWLSELRGGRIVRCAPDGEVTRYPVGGAPNGTALAGDGSLWFCDAERNQVRRFDPASGDTEVMIEHIEGQPLDAPNDLAFHPDGSLVFTCPGSSRREPTGYVCRRTADGTVTRIADGLLFPNGIAFSPDASRIVIAETYGCRVIGGAWQAQLHLAPLLETPGPIGADGVAVTGDGSLHSCVYGGGILRSATPGHPARDIALPDAHPAGCAADPLGRWDLIITGTETGILLGVTL
jgi:gluconolactonase